MKPNECVGCAGAASCGHGADCDCGVGVLNLNGGDLMASGGDDGSNGEGVREAVRTDVVE